MALSPRTVSLLRRAGSALARAAVSTAKSSAASTARSKVRSKVGAKVGAASGSSAAASTAYRGDFTGSAAITYEPRADGDADPGEVVWAWVPYEEDHTQGKDRPVLVIGRVGDDLLGLMLTSKDNTAESRDGGPDARPRWFDLGTGEWDRQRRPSEVRLDRVLRLAPSAVRREGATLDRARFDAVADAVRETLGW